MNNEHQQDYGGTCDTCADGVAQLGSLQCAVCLYRDTAVEELDQLIAYAYEAKTKFILKRYEDAAMNLDAVDGMRKKAGELINEICDV